MRRREAERKADAVAARIVAALRDGQPVAVRSLAADLAVPYSGEKFQGALRKLKDQGVVAVTLKGAQLLAAEPPEVSPVPA